MNIKSRKAMILNIFCMIFGFGSTFGSDVMVCN